MVMFWKELELGRTIIPVGIHEPYHKISISKNNGNTPNLTTLPIIHAL